MIHLISKASGAVFIGKEAAKYFADYSGCYIQVINTIYIGYNTTPALGIKIISVNYDKSDLSKQYKIK